MATNYPGSLDDTSSLPDPTGSTSTNGNHASLHDSENAAIRALEAKLGTSNSLPGGGSQMLYSTSSGASQWGNMPVGGDLTGTLPNPVLASSGVGAGTYGSSVAVPQITVDGKGRVTAVSEVTITGGPGGGSTSPLTTKGDIWVYSTADTRLPVGTDGMILSADSTQITGLKWISAPASAVWGNITGTLSNQTDLQTALDAKAPTASPTFTGTVINAQGTMIDVYNTVDQTTNYERFRGFWSANVFKLESEAAGTGVARSIYIGDAGGYLQFNGAASSGSPKFKYDRSSATSGSLFQVTASGGLTGGAGVTQYGLKIDPVINQSGTAASTMLLINPSVTAAGSGSQLLIDAQVGGSSKFSVSASGIVTLANALGVPNGGTGATSLTSGNVLVGAGTSAVTATKAAPSGAFVGDTDTQTLTNKTLTEPQITGSASVAATPAVGVGKIFGSGTGAVRPHWINSSGTDETIITNADASYSGWQSWTPTLINFTQGNGTIDARYIKIGKTILFRITFTLGTTSAVGSSGTFSLPVTASSSYTFLSAAQVGISCSIQSGTGSFLGTCRLESATTLRPVIGNAAGTYTTEAGITATAPFTWASGNILYMEGKYEAV